MTPERYIIYNEATGIVVNVVTVEDSSEYPPTFAQVMVANRSLNIGDVVPNEHGTQRRLAVIRKRTG